MEQRHLADHAASDAHHLRMFSKSWVGAGVQLIDGFNRVWNRVIE